MPNPMLRALLAISALVAALLIVGVGVAVADGGDGTGTGEPGDPPPATQPVVVEPAPTAGTPPSIFDIPRNIANQLRDMMGRPLSIFGNGRTPGTHTLPDGEVTANNARKRDKAAAAEKAAPTPPEPVISAPTQEDSSRRYGNSSVDDTLPSAAPPATVGVPDVTGLRWRLDLSDPYAVYTSIGQTLNTVNSLLADAYAPYNPFKPPPPPTPEPTFRIMEEEPVDAGGTVQTAPMANGSDLPVVQAPVVVPPLRLPPSEPITGSPIGSAPANAAVPSGAGNQLPRGADAAAEPAPVARGSGAQPGSTPAEQLPPNASTSAMFNSGTFGVREGYPQYLRSARLGQVATVALPGLAGLIALTAGGGVIGYRQANSGRHLRSEAERFVQ
ncbi:MAG: hypothetical protein ABW001_15735 [Mycobacterium sp.]